MKKQLKIIMFIAKPIKADVFYKKDDKLEIHLLHLFDWLCPSHLKMHKAALLILMRYLRRCGLLRQRISTGCTLVEQCRSNYRGTIFEEQLSRITIISINGLPKGISNSS